MTYKRPPTHRIRYLSKRGERFMSLEWGNRKLSLNQLHECKSRTR